MFEKEYLKVSPSFNRVTNFNLLSKTDKLHAISHVLCYCDGTCMQANWLSVGFFNSNTVCLEWSMATRPFELEDLKSPVSEWSDLSLHGIREWLQTL